MVFSFPLDLLFLFWFLRRFMLSSAIAFHVTFILALAAFFFALMVCYWLCVVVLVLLVASLYRVCRPGRFGPHRVELSGEGILLETARGRASIPWSAVQLATQYQRSMVVLHHADGFFIVPKRAFPDDGAWARFRQDIAVFWRPTGRGSVRELARAFEWNSITCTASLAAVAFLFLRFCAPVLGPSSADIRVDTGDLRYRYFGIPLQYRRMQEPQRTSLLALAARSDVLRPEWYQCADYTLGSSHDRAHCCRNHYFQITPWIAEDIARPIVAGCPASIPRCSPLLNWLTEYDVKGRASIRHDWRDNVFVIAYMKMKGIRPTPRPANRSSGPPLVRRPEPRTLDTPK